MTIGETIALRRRTAGLSQEALAAQLGVSRQAVSRWETSESLPDAEKIVQLCQILGVSADELLMEAGGNPPGPPGPAAVKALVVKGRRRFFGLFGREPDTLIPWEEIAVIGEDAVFVKGVPTPPPEK